MKISTQLHEGKIYLEFETKMNDEREYYTFHAWMTPEKVREIIKKLEVSLAELKVK